MRRRQLLTLFLFVSCAVAQAPSGDGLAKLRLRLTQLEGRLHKAQALRDIKRLQYSYAHYAESGLWFDLGDLFAANGVAHYMQGDFKGPESLRKFYLQELGRGQMGLADGRIYPHIMIQPVVTVSEDGATAKGRWHVIAMLGSYGASASWAGVVYENKYVFENGVWKINDLSYGSQYSGRYSPPGLLLSKWNLAYHFTAQAAGTPVSPALAALPDVSLASANFETLQQRLGDLTRRAQRLRDETDVLNLQHTYGYSVDQKMWEAAANLFAADGTFESGQRGVYSGRARIRRALDVLSRERSGGDEVNDHLQLATVVHVASDGRTAKARGVELSVSGARGKGGQWEEGIFENEYVKQDGAWKIRSMHYYPRVITDYEAGWAKDAKPAPGPSTEFPPDRPPTEIYSIYPRMYYPRFHYNNPVTGSAVQYPAGITATVQSESSLPALANSPKNAKEFLVRLTEVERQIDSGIAFDAAENLVNSYGYFLEDSKADELQALFSNPPRSSAESGSSPAVYQTVQPVIQLAADGKSATVRARLLKVGGKDNGLASGIYEGRAVVRSGTWKLQDLAFKPTWSSSFTTWAPVVERGR